jgi:hypothetical protein
MEYRTITSPINGIAGTRQVAPGNSGKASRLCSQPFRMSIGPRLREYQRAVPVVSANENRGKLRKA